MRKFLFLVFCKFLSLLQGKFGSGFRGDGVDWLRPQPPTSMAGLMGTSTDCGMATQMNSVSGGRKSFRRNSSHNFFWVQAVIAGLGLVSCQAQAQEPPPRLFFTDLESGPNSGGQHNQGVFITVWGEGFGANRGDSTVTLGGQEVSRYVLWSADNAVARDMDMIVVQPGPEAMTGNLVVTVGGQSSNPLPFTVRNGQVYFVIQDATNANDSNAGTFEAPFSSIYRARAVMQAGDVVYIRGGLFNQTDPNNPGWDAILSLDTNDASIGSVTQPVAWIGYPGKPPTLANPATRRGILMFTSGVPQSHYVIANMVFSQSQNPISLYGVGHRIVGNVVQDGAFDDTGAISIDGGCDGFRIFGNLLRRNGSPGEKLHHAVYLGGYGANTGIEIGWNQIEDQHGGRAIQLYGHLDGDWIDQISIHENLIGGSELNNVLIGGSDGATDVIGSVELFNNIILGSGDEGLRVNDPSGTVLIQNNVLYNNGSAQLFVERGGAGRLTLENNIIFTEGDQAYIEFGSEVNSTAIQAQRNLYYNAGPRPDWDSDSLESDPRFVALISRDFHLQPLSSAIDGGFNTGRNRDYEGIVRPQGSAYDIGVFEFETETGQPSPTPSASPTASVSAPTETPTMTPTLDTTATATVTPIPEDINRDGYINAIDQLLLLRQWHRGEKD